MKITKENFNKILYCPKCGSANIYLRVLQNQITGICEDMTNAAAEEKGFCKDCGARVYMYTIKEMWSIWVAFGKKHVQRDGVCMVTTDSFLGWSSGTPVEDINQWFAARCPNSIAEDLL